jgi:transposase
MGDTRLEPLVLTGEERRTLENGVRRRATAQGLAVRARIVLACAEGGSNLAVAARLGVNRHTVGKWRARFLRGRLEGLPDEPRPGVPRTITDAQVEEVVVRTLEEAPEGGTHWPERELAARVGISPSSVLRIWRAFGLQPWRTETFKISPDPLLIDKIRDVVGLYLAPPAGAAVFSVDEKPQIQALERTAPVLPMMPGVPERRSFDYDRHGSPSGRRCAIGYAEPNGPATTRKGSAPMRKDGMEQAGSRNGVHARAAYASAALTCVSLVVGTTCWPTGPA